MSQKTHRFHNSINKCIGSRRNTAPFGYDLHIQTVLECEGKTVSFPFVVSTKSRGTLLHVQLSHYYAPDLIFNSPVVKCDKADSCTHTFCLFHSMHLFLPAYPDLNKWLSSYWTWCHHAYANVNISVAYIYVPKLKWIERKLFEIEISLITKNVLKGK